MEESFEKPCEESLGSSGNSTPLSERNHVINLFIKVRKQYLLVFCIVRVSDSQLVKMVKVLTAKIVAPVIWKKIAVKIDFFYR